MYRVREGTCERLVQLYLDLASEREKKRERGQQAARDLS
jgi:hypothetical protein